MSAPVPVIRGNYDALKKKVRAFVEENVAVCQPDNLWICDGSLEECNIITESMVKQGLLKPLPKYKNCYLALTDPADVARVESKTVIVTKKREDAVPTTKQGVNGELGIWMSPDDFEKAAAERYPGCMKGRTMYVIPFSMGPVGSTLSKIGVQLTDSEYVVLSMRVMTRMGQNVLDTLGVGDFVHCLHSVGCPLPTTRQLTNGWACNPEKVLVAHFPEKYEIKSFGSAYGGNALLGKKCFALRIGCTIARDEGWFAEHMLISRIEMPNGKAKYITAAFPSACGKTNLAMLTPTIPGYKVTCVGDDICWMRFDDKGVLRAINPEAGFFGVAPGTSYDSNPMAMATIFENTIFTNVAETSDGGVWWEGMETPPAGVSITDWHGKPWTPDCGRLAAHPNSRFAAPARNCPIIDKDWESPKGVPIDAVIFGGRRPEGVPLVYESFSWNHGVFVGATVRSETTAAAQDGPAVKVVRSDPFAMKPFFGYNFGHYLRHWLHFGQIRGLRLPKIYHVNWFRKDSKSGKFLWPGFGENSRVIDWICRRLEGEDCADLSPVGYVPKPDSINIKGLQGNLDMEQLLSAPRDFWLEEYRGLKKFFQDQLPMDTPVEIENELYALKSRITNIPRRVVGVRYIHSHPCTVAKGDLESLPPKVRTFVLETMEMCTPASVYICDGSYEERLELLKIAEDQGTIVQLPKYRNCYLARTDPDDIGRTAAEAKTFTITPREEDVVPTPAAGVKSNLGKWMSPQEYQGIYQDRFKRAMTGRTMYVLPFSMGPVGSSMARYGVQLTDSPYVAASLTIMTRTGNKALTALGQKNFVRCLHSVGGPLDVPNRHTRDWPCDPERVIVAHIPETWEIHSYGSAYGGNSIASKRSFALRLGSAMGASQGFMAERIKIIGVTNPAGKKRYFALCFPAGCGRLHMSMMESALPGYKITCVNDDTAWMHFDNHGDLRAVNPEAGIFGLCVGTNYQTNPKAMKMIFENTIFTNVAETSDGGVFWEGLEEPPTGISITDWRGKPWTRASVSTAAQPNSRFCTPISQCPVVDQAWDDQEGVVIDAVLFATRRTDAGGIPLVMEAGDWNQGVFLGASMRTLDTTTNQVVNDPFAMRAYLGVNFGTYLRHWLGFGLRKGLHLPKVYEVNWFRTNNNGRLLWSGFAENARVLDWVFRRLEGEQCAEVNKLGMGVPSREGGIKTDGLAQFDYDALFGIDTEFWKRELAATRKFFDDYLPVDLPSALLQQLNTLQGKL